jgi:hypothetical protein
VARVLCYGNRGCKAVALVCVEESGLSKTAALIMAPEHVCHFWLSAAADVVHAALVFAGGYS